MAIGAHPGGNVKEEVDNKATLERPLTDEYNHLHEKSCRSGFRAVAVGVKVKKQM